MRVSTGQLVLYRVLGRPFMYRVLIISSLEIEHTVTTFKHVGAGPGLQGWEVV